VIGLGSDIVRDVGKNAEIREVFVRMFVVRMATAAGNVMLTAPRNNGWYQQEGGTVVSNQQILFLLPTATTI